MALPFSFDLDVQITPTTRMDSLLLKTFEILNIFKLWKALEKFWYRIVKLSSDLVTNAVNPSIGQGILLRKKIHAARSAVTGN